MDPASFAFRSNLAIIVTVINNPPCRNPATFCCAGCPLQIVLQESLLKPMLNQILKKKLGENEKSFKLLLVLLLTLFNWYQLGLFNYLYWSIVACNRVSFSGRYIKISVPGKEYNMFFDLLLLFRYLRFLV